METQCSVCRRAAAKFACSCAFPPLAVCSGCLAPHMETEGAHNSIPIQKKAAPMTQVQGNEVCDGCHAKPALRFCLCAVPLRKYCEDCDIAHYRKAPLLNHSEHPLSAYAAVASGRVPLEAFKKKQQFINDFQLRLGQELVNFDAFVNQVGEKFDQLIALATTKKEALLRDLQTQRAKLTELLMSAQQDIETKRYADAFEVKTLVDEILMSGHMASAPPEVQMFAGKVELEHIIELLEKAVTYEVACNVKTYEVACNVKSPLQQEIPVIKGDILRLFHHQTLQMTQATLSQSTRIDQYTAYCYIKADTLLCCGGGYHNEVYEINVRTRVVEKAANMSAVRQYAGIWNYRNGFVYIFGGYTGSASLNTAEKYGLSSKTWTNLRAFLPIPAIQCSVCEHAKILYISGRVYPVTNPGSSISYFNPENESFALLRSESSNISPILCCAGDSLYCIRNTIEEANLSNGPAAAAFVTKANIPVLGNGYYWLSCPMQWSGGELTSVLICNINPFGLFRFSPAKLQFTQVADFLY